MPGRLEKNTNLVENVKEFNHRLHTLNFVHSGFDSEITLSYTSYFPCDEQNGAGSSKQKSYGKEQRIWA